MSQEQSFLQACFAFDSPHFSVWVTFTALPLVLLVGTVPSDDVKSPIPIIIYY